MFLEFLLILAIYKADFQYQYVDFSEKESVEVVEFGDCEQLPHQKTLGQGD